MLLKKKVSKIKIDYINDFIHIKKQKYILISNYINQKKIISSELQCLIKIFIKLELYKIKNIHFQYQNGFFIINIAI